MQAEQRHRVVLRQHLDRGIVHIGAVRRVEPAGLHPAGEEAGMLSRRVAGDVLVELQRHQRHLRASRQPGHRPRRGVGLLELVDRPGAQQVEHLLASARRWTCTAIDGPSCDST